MTNNGQDGDWDEPRRSFSSRTPANENPDHVMYRRGFVTRHQVSGWRFVVRRIASGIALHDTRMLVDPLRTQSRAVLMGVVLLVTGLAGCFVFSLIRPAGSAGTNPVLADRSTAALYVRIGDQLHPVLNLMSARLIVGRPVNPTMVKSTELERFSPGNLIGIPGAPERMEQNTSHDARWTVCDAVSGASRDAHSAGVTVISGPPADGGARAATLGPTRALLVDASGDRVGAGADGDRVTWLLWAGKRSRINLADHPVTAALGLGTDTPTARPVASGLLNAIPEAPPLAAPIIPNAGAPAPYSVPAPVGAVVASYSLDPPDAVRYYAVLPDGLQPISPVLASILRNSNSFGLDQPPRLGADAVAKLPVSGLLDTGRYPDQPLTVVDAAQEPVTCASWSRGSGAATSSVSLLSGSALPISDSIHPLELVGGGATGTAARVALPPGTGYFTQTVGGSATGSAVGPTTGALFWVSDTGVRYGIDTEADKETSTAGHGKTVEALGLSGTPVPIPWSVLSLFASGPTLSRADALLAHDGLMPDPTPGRVAAEGEPR
ncbi:MAG: type VII secretion protein EccB [Mycobacterium sp.]